MKMEVIIVLRSDHVMVMVTFVNKRNDMTADTVSIFCIVANVKEDGELVPLEGQDSMEKIKMVRTNAKKKVFVTNAIRSLAKVSPTGNVRDIEFVVLVGGSALDFEVPTLVTDALSQYNIVAGRGNIRGCEGPRNAVATGLAMSCADV